MLMLRHTLDERFCCSLLFFFYLIEDLFNKEKRIRHPHDKLVKSVVRVGFCKRLTTGKILSRFVVKSEDLTE